MGENSKIEWCDHTMNFWIGCQEVSSACDNCYAREQNKRWHHVEGWGPDGERRRTRPANWAKLRAWDLQARAKGVRAKVFCNSLSDFFDNRVPHEWRRDAWQEIGSREWLDFLILTKRPQNIAKMLPMTWGGAGWPNVWLGTTVENRLEGQRRAIQLAEVPAVVRFWSCEPLLEDLGDCTGLCLRDTAIDGRPAVSWVICGGESGPHRRPMDLTWARSLRDQCFAAGVPFFMKQIDKVKPIPSDLMVRQFPRTPESEPPGC